ncbi:MAG: hypothetical protein BWY19_01222 [bacterium ADurb.Bin212]|nr:MAG: hypothetical protein BWY19_01222 [bacterium ADurb.Bin212]
MKKMIVSLFLVSFLLGCTSEILRPSGKPYPGYACNESLLHFYSYCSKDKFIKEEFDAKVAYCEKQLATKICDREQASLLWCMGRVVPGTYSTGGGYVYGGKYGGFYTGNSSIADGCDCSYYEGALKKCRLEKGMFDSSESSIVPARKD